MFGEQEIEKAREGEIEINYNTPEYQDELAKAMIIVNEAISEGIVGRDDIELVKGKAAQDGEVRVWGGQKFEKTGKTWNKVQPNKYSHEHLIKHAENTSSGQLKRMFEHGDKRLADAAKRELERRNSEKDKEVTIDNAPDPAKRIKETIN